MLLRSFYFTSIIWENSWWHRQLNNSYRSCLYLYSTTTMTVTLFGPLRHRGPVTEMVITWFVRNSFFDIDLLTGKGGTEASRCTRLKIEYYKKTKICKRRVKGNNPTKRSGTRQTVGYPHEKLRQISRLDKCHVNLWESTTCEPFF